jgi:hypothetical protein
MKGSGLRSWYNRNVKKRLYKSNRHSFDLDNLADLPPEEIIQIEPSRIGTYIEDFLSRKRYRDQFNEMQKKAIRYLVLIKKQDDKLRKEGVSIEERNRRRLFVVDKFLKDNDLIVDIDRSNMTRSVRQSIIDDKVPERYTRKSSSLRSKTRTLHNTFTDQPNIVNDINMKFLLMRQSQLNGKQIQNLFTKRELDYISENNLQDIISFLKRHKIMIGGRKRKTRRLTTIYI